VLDPARDVEALAITGRVVRAGRTQMVTEARFADRASRARVVAYGTATWAVVAPCPPGYRYVDPTAATVPGGTAPPIVDAFDATPRSGGGFELAGLSARVGASSLHQGPIQVMLEAAAYERACEAAGSQALDPLHANVSIVQRGIRGPFVASAEVVARSRGSVACRAELRDDGADGRVVAFGLARYSSEESTE
jgi:acyl-coenzyme A thioesterase PaaI-like protein